MLTGKTSPGLEVLNGIDVQGDPVNFTDPEGLSGAGWVVKFGDRGLRKIRKLLSKKEAQQARRQGDNVLAKSKQQAKAIEKGAHGGQDMMRHKGHDLRDGGRTGEPHYQTNGKYGHTFWSSTAGLVLSFFDPTDLISGELGADDMLNPDGTYGDQDNNCN